MFILGNTDNVPMNDEEGKFKSYKEAEVMPFDGYL
jgi:hypothetical protein